LLTGFGHRRARAGNRERGGNGLGRSHAFEGRIGADPASQLHDGLHQVSPGDSRHLGSGLLDHSDEFVADGPDGVGALTPLVPQVGPADAGQHDPDDGVGRLTDHRVWLLADLDVPRSAEMAACTATWPLARCLDASVAAY
jgi:hypothetical protein